MRPTPVAGWLAVMALAVGACTTTAPTPRPTAIQPSPAPIDLPTVRAEIEAAYGDKLILIGNGAGVIGVGFRATDMDAAAAVVAKYGSAVTVTVGLFPFPPPAGLPNLCPAMMPKLIAPGPLRATIEMPSRISHGYFQASVRVRNVGSEPVDLVTGQPLLIYLYKPDSSAVVGAGGASGGSGLEPNILPGASTVIAAGGATSACDFAFGYELPDGQYVARAAVESGLNAFLSEPFPLTLASAP